VRATWARLRQHFRLIAARLVRNADERRLRRGLKMILSFEFGKRGMSPADHGLNGYVMGSPMATGLWHDALVRKGSRFGLLAEGGVYEDYLVGVIVVISGDSKLKDELFIRLL
jgi:hypothetical protein